MTARVGDEIMVLPQELHEPVREGQIREIRHDPGGVVYLVQWSDTGPWLSRFRHPLEWSHNRDLERRQQVGYERLALRAEEIIVGLGLTHEDFSIASGRVFHVPQVISAARAGERVTTNPSGRLCRV